MSKKNALATVTIMPPAIQQDAKRFMGSGIEKVRFFKQLKEDDPRVATALLETARHLAAARYMRNISDIAIGAYLADAQEKLAPYSKKGSGYFGQFLRYFHFSRVTAMRYITGYKNAEKMFSPHVLKAVSSRGWEITGDKKRPLGKYTEAVKLLGAGPNTEDPERVNRYLDQVEQTVKEKRSRARKSASKSSEPEPLEFKQAVLQGYQYLYRLFNRVRHNKRRDFIEEVSGMLAADLGVSHLSVKASAVPDGYKPAPRGRPPLPDAEKEAAATA